MRMNLLEEGYFRPELHRITSHMSQARCDLRFYQQHSFQTGGYNKLTVMSV